jgi:hypothetical protein
MPCFRCRVRQTDPERGASPWRRAVVDGEQVLVCPACQRQTDWVSRLDRCAGCGSARLVKALGAVLCRDCGARAEPVPAGTAGGRNIRGSAGTFGEPEAGRPAGADRDLSAEVDAALARILRPEPP